MVGTPPTADDLARLGEAVLKDLPEPFRAAVAHVPILVQDWPDDATLDAMGIEDALDLTGLYAAVPLGQREGMAAPPAAPPRVPGGAGGGGRGAAPPPPRPCVDPSLPPADPVRMVRARLRAG